MKGVNASNSTNALSIIILIIIVVDALVKLKTTLIAQTNNTGVTLIAHANASLKYSMAPQKPTLLKNGTVTAAISTLLRT